MDAYCSLWHKQDGSLLDLPEDVILLLLTYLPFQDLIKCRRVCSDFLKLIDQNKWLWAEARLNMTWPTRQNCEHMFIAARAGNFEAQIKLGIAYVYDEAQNLCLGDSIQVREQLSSELFELADRHVSPPISWIFYRPPWRLSTMDTCCKFILFQKLVDMTTERNDSGRAAFLVSRMLTMAPDRASPSEVKQMLRTAIDRNLCAHSTLLLLRLEDAEGKRRWETARKLREILTRDPCNYEAQLLLCGQYLGGLYGGVSEDFAMNFVRKIFAESKPAISRPSRLMSNSKGRIVVISWMMEVVEEQNYSNSVLHLSIDLFDHFLERQTVPRSHLQLLGITAIVLSTRLLSLRTLTVTQAAWLTDNTYRYIDVVQTMGHIVATLRGHVQAWTTADYVSLLVKRSGCDGTLASMTYYLLERSHFVLVLRCLPRALLAASCFQLASIILRLEPWPKCLQEWTGFTSESLSKTTFILNQTVFVHHYSSGSEWDVPFQKYAEKQFGCVSTEHFRVPCASEIHRCSHDGRQKLVIGVKS